MQTYGSVYEELHYFRNKLNSAPDTIYELLVQNKNTANYDDKWILFNVRHTAYHMFNTEMSPEGECNLKFVSSNNSGNMFEAVYNYDGVLLTAENDPINCGTFNYCSDQKDKSLHQALDVKPYKQYGNVKGYPYPGDDEKEHNKKRYNNNYLAQNNRQYFESQDAFILEQE